MDVTRYEVVNNRLVDVHVKTPAFGEPKHFEDACRHVASEIAELVISKQRDYGSENVMAFGEKGVLVRANDKIARLKNIILRHDGKSIGEKRMDSWTDLAGYAILALMLDKNWFTLPLADEIREETRK